MADSAMTRDEAIVIAKSFADEHELPIGKLAEARHMSAEGYARMRLNCRYGEWLISFHYIGSLTQPHPKVKLRMDVGWLLCVLINDVTGEVALGQDYRGE